MTEDIQNYVEEVTRYGTSVETGEFSEWKIRYVPSRMSSFSKR